MKHFIRNFLLVLSFGIFGAGSLIVGYVIFPFVKFMFKNDERKLLQTYSLIIRVTWKKFSDTLKFFGLITIKIDDEEKLKSIKNSIIACTHPSFTDVLIMLSIIPNTSCIAAGKTKTNIFYKNMVNSMFITSDSSPEDLVKSAEKLFDNGFNLLVFPTGTRHNEDEIPKIHKGISLIAKRLRKDVIPVKISQSSRFLRIHQPFYEAGEDVAEYVISVKDKINTDGFIENYPDEVDFKREFTKEIKKILFENNENT